MTCRTDITVIVDVFWKTNNQTKTMNLENKQNFINEDKMNWTKYVSE